MPGGKGDRAGVDRDRGVSGGSSGGNRSGRAGGVGTPNVGGGFSSRDVSKSRSGKSQKIGKPTDLLSRAPREEIGGVLGAVSGIIGGLVSKGIPGLDIGLDKNIVTGEVGPTFSIDPVDIGIAVAGAINPALGIAGFIGKQVIESGVLGKGEPGSLKTRVSKDAGQSVGQREDAVDRIINPLLSKTINPEIDNSLFDQILANITKGKSPFLSKL